jgi:hypothetical protein
VTYWRDGSERLSVGLACRSYRGIRILAWSELTELHGCEKCRLAVLEADGFVMRGASRRTPRRMSGASAGCSPGSTHYTVKRLRAEIEPVAVRDFPRLLLDWQRVTAETRMQGSDAVGRIGTCPDGLGTAPVAGSAHIGARSGVMTEG